MKVHDMMPNVLVLHKCGAKPSTVQKINFSKKVLPEDGITRSDYTPHTLPCLSYNPLSLLYTYASCSALSPQFLAERSYCKTSLMESLISTYLPADLMERSKVYHEEMAEFSK